MTVAQVSLIIIGIIVVVLVAVPVVASVIRDRDYKRQIAGKKPMREFKEDFQKAKENQSTEDELLNKYEMDMKAKQNVLHAGGISGMKF